MGSALSYSGINTKVKAMGANLICTEEYQKIANFDSTSDFIAFLKNHPGYREIFMHYDEHELHRFDAERIFINGFYQDYSKIYRFANEDQRKDLKIIFFRHEVNVLKNYIRLLYNEEATYDLSMFQQFFDKHSQIQVSALAGAGSIEEYIRGLKDTEYYPMLTKLQGKNNVSSFDYEIQLDIYYFKRIWKLKEKLMKGDTLKAFVRYMGTQIDLLNIMWIYRSKVIYDVNMGDVLFYVIPVNYKLSKDQLIKLAKASTFDEFVSTLQSTYYKPITSSLIDGTIENTYQSIITKMFKQNQMKYPASMNTVNFYLHRKETEISRLTTALECIRYNLAPQEKLNYILNH